MFKKIRQVMPYFAKRTRRLAHGLTCLVLVLPLGYPLSATASSVPLPVVTVEMADTFNYSRNFFDTAIPENINQPYYVSGQVEITTPLAHSQFASGADIYFGVILPGGTTVHTWSPNSNGTVTLKSGYAPIAKAQSLLTVGTFNTASVNGGNRIRHDLSGSETKGLYLLFMFLVPTGTDPTDIRQWSFVTMKPLYVK
jgi:hypothetical protein